MVADGRYAATVDRIEDGEIAVLLVEANSEVVAQADVPVERLPEGARTGGAVLDVEIEDDELRDVTYDPEATGARRRRLRERFDRLAERPPESDDAERPSDRDDG